MLRWQLFFRTRSPAANNTCHSNFHPLRAETATFPRLGSHPRRYRAWDKPEGANSGISLLSCFVGGELFTTFTSATWEVGHESRGMSQPRYLAAAATLPRGSARPRSHGASWWFVNRCASSGRSDLLLHRHPAAKGSEIKPRQRFKIRSVFCTLPVTYYEGDSFIWVRIYGDFINAEI